MLHALEIFKNWTRTAVERIMLFFYEKKFKRGWNVFSEGDVSEEAYLIKEGSFKLTTGIKIEENEQNKSPIKNKAFPLPTYKRYYKGEIVLLSRGQFFGEDGIVMNKPREFT